MLRNNIDGDDDGDLCQANGSNKLSHLCDVLSHRIIGGYSLAAVPGFPFCLSLEVEHAWFFYKNKKLKCDYNLINDNPTNTAITKTGGNIAQFTIQFTGSGGC